MTFQVFAAEAERKLAGHSPTLPEEFRTALNELSPSMSEAELRAWAEEGLALAEHSLRSWEAASEYFKVSPKTMRSLAPPAFRRWVHAGRDLAEQSSVVAMSYFRSSPRCVAYLDEHQLTEWAALGKHLYRGHWKSISLASMFFSAGPGLLPLLTMEQLARLTALIEVVAERSYELASDCLDGSPHMFGSLAREERAPFLTLASSVADASWSDVRLLFQNTPTLLEAVATGQRSRLLALGTRVSGHLGRHAYALFSEGAQSLASVPQDAHSDLLGLAEELAVGSPAAAMEFLKSAPSVLERVRIDDLHRWHDAGRRILETSEAGGEAFFRLESGKGEEVLQNLSSRVELSSVGEVLRLYCKALAGADISIHPAAELMEKGIGWVSEARPSTEGTRVYLPDAVDEHVDKGQNFSVYKVYATHQTAHLEFGSFWFRFARKGSALPRRRHIVERERKAEHKGAGAVSLKADPRKKSKKAMTDMERFFDLFDERQAALDLFTIVEDVRIDALVRREYGGIRRSWGRTQEAELERRPDPRDLPLRQALIENLVRYSLDGARAMVWPARLNSVLGEALRLLDQVRPGSNGKGDPIVEDSAECTLLLYDLVMGVPNVSPEQLEGMEWDEINEDTLELMMSSPSGRRGGRRTDARRRGSRVRQPAAGRFPRRFQAGAGPAPDAPSIKGRRASTGRALAADGGATARASGEERRD